MRPGPCRAGAAACALSLLVLLTSAPVLAYTPGSGDLYTDDFEGEVDEGWQSGNCYTTPCPWEHEPDGLDQSFYADGLGPFAQSPTLHRSQRTVTPVTVTSFSIAFEYRGELGAGYRFQLDVEQRSPDVLIYRLEITEGGGLVLYRTEGGAFVPVASAPDNTVPANDRRWIRFSVEEDGSGHPALKVRVWSGSAGAEPGSWTLQFVDDLDTLQRVHRFTLDADGPKGIETWIDDMDLWGDAGRGIISSIEHVYIAELSHLDIGFTEPPDDIEEFAKTHLDQVLDNVAADPDYRWFIESYWFLENWWTRSTPEEHQEMISRLQEGRITLAASYANQTSTMVGHEELIRNIYHSSAFGREHGVPVRAWITDDVPGSTFAIPEILARAGMDYYLGGMNCSFGGNLTEPDHGDRPFWWVGPDGSRVLAWITFDSYAEAFHWGFSFFDGLADMYTKLAEKMPEQEEAGYAYPEIMIFRGFDNHYQGFKARNLADQWNATYETPVFHLITPEAFLDMMVQKYGAESFPEYSGDFGAAWARSRANAPHGRRMVRQAHRDARSAEAMLAAGSSLDGAPVSHDDIEFMYRKILTVDEHTGPGGWPGYFTPEEMDRNNRIHLGYAEDASGSAAALLEEGLDRALAGLPAAGNAVAAVNTLGRPMDGPVRIALPQAIWDTTFRVVERSSGTEVPFQRIDASLEILFLAENVPAAGYRVYDLVPGAPTASPPGMLTVTSTSIENDFYALTIDPSDGSVSSLVEKSTGRQLVDTSSDYDFNELAWNTHNEATYLTSPHADPPSSASTGIEWSGPLAASVKVTRSGNAHSETWYRLYNGVDRVEIENVVNRDLMPYVAHGSGSRLYVVTMPFDIHDFDLRTETTTRFLDPLTDGFDRASVFDYHNAEHTLAFWDDGGGVIYASDSVGAHHFVTLSTLASTSFATSTGLLLPRMLDKADEYEYDGGTIGQFWVEPDTSPLHHITHHFRGTTAGFDPETASKFGFEALTPMQARLLSRGPGNLPDGAASFFDVETPGVLPYTFKPATVGDGVVLRMTELTGAATAARVRSDIFALSSPEEVEADEEGGVPLAMDGDGFLVNLGPYETRTVRFRAEANWAPIDLRVNKGGGDVKLSWTGGVTPYSVERADDAQFTAGKTLLLDEVDTGAHDDPVLGDGQAYYYLVK